MTELNLLVIRAADPRNPARFYSTLDLEFTEEDHGSPDRFSGRPK